MLTTIWMMALLAQPEAASGAPAAGGAAGPAGCEGLGGSAFMMIAMVAVMYFIVLRPQKKQQDEHAAFIKSLRAGLTVRTSGGIRAEVVEVNEADVTVAIAPGVKINVLKSHLTAISTPSAAEPAKDKG